MVCRTLLLCTIAVRTTALAPSFDTFSAAATGSWHGTLYEWPGDTNGAACESVVDEVMRSCGGAVQGVRVDDGPLLNRQDDGFCFFDCGSWTQGPTKIADGIVHLDVALVAQSGSRVRCTASVSAGHVVDAIVVVEEKAGAAPLAKRESLAAAGSPRLAQPPPSVRLRHGAPRSAPNALWWARRARAPPPGRFSLEVMCTPNSYACSGPLQGSNIG